MPHILFTCLLLIVSPITFDWIAGLTMQTRTNHASQQVLSEHQPVAQDAQIKQQAETAVALLKQGKDKNFWLLLRHSPDPSLRYRFGNSALTMTFHSLPLSSAIVPDS